MTIPYWDWTDNSTRMGVRFNEQQQQSPSSIILILHISFLSSLRFLLSPSFDQIWKTQFFGGNGTSANKTIEDGPFASWNTTVDVDGKHINLGIVRTLGAPASNMNMSGHVMEDNVR